MFSLLNLILILSFINRAYLSDIVAQGDTDVVLGQDASLSCTLPFMSGVKQVTWQRVRTHKDVQTLATFSEQFQDNVLEDYVGKVTLTLATFNSTTITIKNTTFEDEACYICSFKVYPSGPKRKTLCLTVKGISEITAEVNPSPTSESDVVVSCSATGKPTPTIQWKSSEKDLKHFTSKNFTTLNKDSSTTITSNITIPLSQFHGKFVECLAQSGSVEKMFQIYLPQDDEANNTTPRSYIITFSVIIVMAIVITVICVIYLHPKLKRASSGMKSLHDPNERC
ncbi:OX-2 membrane glycoprotein-like [Pimephales promelas]|uniref:OX-2 membrane glycoprotein-like n=1 Tax=Pimephales promelas TaxID=90988 RepID=UPI0019557F22|nr:OX-2 membrane glycoprotein-like [Pimephales promelas]KAG1961295.1 OX-2 membrane glycoprotein [Pimephales promelas]